MLRRLGAYPFLFSIIVWGSAALEVGLRGYFPLSPIPATTSYNARHVRIPLLRFLPSFGLDSLSLSTPAATARIIVFTVLITYLTATFASTELPTFFIPGVQITTNYSFVEFCSTDVSQTSESLGARVEFDEAESTWCP